MIKHNNFNIYYSKTIQYIRSPYKIIRYFVYKYATYLKWMPDRLYIKILYFGVTGKNLRLSKSSDMLFSEKLQWLKLYDRKTIYTSLVDKYKFRQYISEEAGEEYLIPLLGVWDKFEDIDLSILPEQFVLKCTHDSASVLVCRDKNKFDVNSARIHFKKNLNRNLYWYGREWPYKFVEPRIIAEKYMEETPGNINGLTDYKFHCFNGIPKFLYISRGLENHDTAYMSFYDLNGNELPFKRSDYNTFPEKIIMPPCFNEMISLSEKFARKVGSPFLRVDLLFIGGQIYFSEFTFTPTNGLMPLEPKRWDLILGNWLRI